MVEKKDARCHRCGQRLKKGGDNYRLDCTIIADFDGYIDNSTAQKGLNEAIEEIELSGLTEEELQEQVYLNIKQKLCFDCRNEIANYLKGISSDE